MDIITREEALSKGLKRYFTGKPCIHGHVAERTVLSNHGCIICLSISRKKWNETNSEYYKKWKIEHFEIVQESKEKWRKNNLDKIASINKKYRQNNLGYHTAKSKKYKAFKLHRTPIWLTKNDLKKIEQVYIFSQMLSKTRGIKYVVDHIIPLQGRNNSVSGLHIFSNLDIITNKANCIKSNTFVV